jgi:hypothetical protein
MNNLHALSPEILKQAGLQKAVMDLASRKDFLGGLAAPVAKLFGGGQKLVGTVQKAIPQIKNFDKPLSEIADSPLMQQGAKNVQQGDELRKLTSLFSKDSWMPRIFDKSLPTQYRVGRGLSTAAVGAPLVYAPFNLAEYAGAANADVGKATGRAKQMAANRIKQRTEQFANMPFLERIQTAWNPEKFTSQIAESAPELQDLAQASQTGGITPPGVMSYLASLNPFLSSPSDVIKQKTRSALMDLMREKGLDMNKSGTDKKANKLILEGLKNAIKPAWNLGRQTAKANKNLSAPLPNLIKDPNHTPIQDFLSRTAYSVAKNPGTAAAKGIAGIGVPYGMYASYNAGKQQVEDQLTQDAAAMADMQAMNTFATPGLAGGLGRLIAALAPGIIGNKVNAAAGGMLSANNMGAPGGGYVQSLYAD